MLRDSHSSIIIHWFESTHIKRCTHSFVSTKLCSDNSGGLQRNSRDRPRITRFRWIISSMYQYCTEQVFKNKIHFTRIYHWLLAYLI